MAGCGVSNEHAAFQCGVTVHTEDPAPLAIRVNGPAEIATHVACGGDGPESGWVAPAYGQREPAAVARFSLTTQVPATIWQVFYPALTSEPALSIARRQGEAADGLLVETSGRSDLLIVAHHPGRCVTIGGLKTDALLVWLWQESLSETVQGALLNGSYVSWFESDLWRAPLHVKHAAFEGHLPDGSLDLAAATR